MVDRARLYSSVLSGGARPERSSGVIADQNFFLPSCGSRLHIDALSVSYACGQIRGMRLF